MACVSLLSERTLVLFHSWTFQPVNALLSLRCFVKHCKPQEVWLLGWLGQRPCYSYQRCKRGRIEDSYSPHQHQTSCSAGALHSSRPSLKPGVAFFFIYISCYHRSNGAVIENNYQSPLKPYLCLCLNNTFWLWAHWYHLFLSEFEQRTSRKAPVHYHKQAQTSTQE